MINFDFQLKTKIYFGKDKENEIASILNEHGFKRIAVIIGKGSVRKSGLLDRVTSLLDESNIEYILIEGVRANPTIDFVKPALKTIKGYRPELLLAIGGGSVIDTAKSLGVGYYYDGDPFDFNLHKCSPSKCLSIGVILTISAAGSEMSTSCVIQDDLTGTKAGFNSELVRPLFAIENPELTYSVSKAQTGYGVVDIMMHTLERYFQPSDELEFADDIALGLLKNVVKAGGILVKEPENYQARASIMLASSFSHNGLTSIGKKFFMPVHQMEHALSGLYPSVAHGEGLAVLFPAWATYYVKYDVDKFDQLAKVVFDSFIEDKMKNALEGINRLKEFFRLFDMPLTFEDLNIPDIDIEKIVNKISNNGERIIPHHIKPMDKEVMYEICTLASRR